MKDWNIYFVALLIYSLFLYFNPIDNLWHFISTTIKTRFQLKDLYRAVTGGDISNIGCCAKKYPSIFKMICFSLLFVKFIDKRRMYRYFSNFILDFLWHGMKILLTFWNFTNAQHPQHPRMHASDIELKFQIS